MVILGLMSSETSFMMPKISNRLWQYSATLIGPALSILALPQPLTTLLECFNTHRMSSTTTMIPTTLIMEPATPKKKESHSSTSTSSLAQTLVSEIF